VSVRARLDRLEAGAPPAAPVADDATVAAERSLAEFVRQAWPIIEPRRKLVWGPHLDAVCFHLEAVASGKIRDLIIAIPPRSSKSSIVSVLYPVWEWIRRPHTRFLTASYAMSLAIRDTLRSRRVLESPWFQERWGERCRITGDQNTKGRYEDEATGYRLATSVGGGVTGEGGDVLIVDDAHNVIDAESAPVMEMTRRWWDEAFSNRVNDARTAARIIVGQRVAVGDLIGHVLKQGGFEQLRLPEEFEAGNRSSTSIGWSDWRTKEGELLRPERFGPDQVAEAKRRLGGVGYAAQHQQRPVPREGAVYKAAWFKPRYTDMGDGWHVRDRVHPYSSCIVFSIMDPAGGVSTSADHTAIGSFAVTDICDLLILDMVAERIPLEQIVRRLAEVCGRWKPTFIGIEKGFLQNAIIREAMKCPGLPPVRPLDPEGKNKLVRSMQSLIRAENGQIWLPDHADWTDDFLEEMLQFTGGGSDRRDDRADVLAYAAKLVEEVGPGSFCLPIGPVGAPRGGAFGGVGRGGVYMGPGGIGMGSMYHGPRRGGVYMGPGGNPF
jgi:predicted phage terminase large subunit-like protein